MTRYIFQQTSLLPKSFDFTEIRLKKLN